ncbi:MAG: Gfo/Idh/MocA family oxidoreductase [Pseudomonadota bacterium]
MVDGVKRGALIGCGFFSQNHLHGWQDVTGAEIVAVCDLDREKAEAVGREFGIAAVFTDAEKMLAETDLDFVDVATTPPSHRALVELVSGHRLAVICQKPVADTYADAKAMVDAAEAAGVPFLVHENFRWQLGFLRIKAELEAGRIGTPRFARLSFRHGFNVYARQPYLATIERFALMDVGIHLYDVVRHLMGEVHHLACETASLRPGIAGEDSFTSLLRHTSGAVSVVECSFASTIHPEPFPSTLTWIEGDKGTLELTADLRLHVHTEGDKAVETVDPAVPAWGARPWHTVQDSVIRFQAHVVDVLNGKAEPQPSGRDNLNTLALTLASYDAMQHGRLIDIARWQEQQ